MHWCNSIEEVIEFIAYVVLTAPDDFPPEDNMTIDQAFSELEYGLNCVQGSCGNTVAIQKARALFQEAHALYTQGKANEGAWKLQDAEQILTQS